MYEHIHVYCLFAYVVNTRIQHFGSKDQERVISEAMVTRSLMIIWLFGCLESNIFMVPVSASLYTNIDTCTYAYIYTYVYIGIYVYAYMYIHICAYVYMYIYIHMYIYIWTYTRCMFGFQNPAI